MGKHKKNGPRFVQLFHWEMDSAAYRDLSGNARSIYIEIKRRYNGSNNGFIVYSVRQAADALKIGKTTAAKAFRELISHGFIVAEQRGAFHWKIDVSGERHRPASEWRLTAYPSDRATGHESRYQTKEFMRWPEIQNTVRPQVRLVPNTRPIWFVRRYHRERDQKGGWMSGHGTCNGTHIIYQVGGRQAKRFLFVPPFLPPASLTRRPFFWVARRVR